MACPKCPALRTGTADPLDAVTLTRHVSPATWPYDPFTW